MKKIGIFYGSTTGTTADVASRIAKAMNVAEADVIDVGKTAPDRLGEYDVAILGTSTWGSGDMQSDWYDFLDGAEALDLRGKKFALFGVGDESMTETFCSGMGELYKRFLKTGATPVGVFNEDGFTFNHSGAVVDGKVVGLVLDETNHPDLTADKINEWVKLVESEI